MATRHRRLVLSAALVIVLVGVLAIVLVRSHRTAPPVLLDEANFSGAEDVDQDTAQAPNWTFCAPLAGIRGERVAGTYVSFGRSDDTVIASLIDGSAFGVSADENLKLVEHEADVCTESVKDAVSGPMSIEPLTGLRDDSVGWRATLRNDVVGEYVAIRLDDWRVLAVSFQTSESTPRVDMDDLVRLAREGAAQFEPDQD